MSECGSETETDWLAGARAYHEWLYDGERVTMSDFYDFMRSRMGNGGT